MLIARTYYLWNGNEWEYFNIESHIYDEYVNLVQTLFQDWESGAWADKRLDHFTWLSSSNVPEAFTGDIEVYPNPTKGKFQITSHVLRAQPEGTKFQINSKTQINSKLQNEIDRIEVVDLFGKEVDAFVCNLKFGACLVPSTRDGACNLEFDISGYPAGVYFVRIYFDDKLIVKKIIKVS
jgi:hypothetical protein